jgi:hypothetical protein
MTKTPQIEFYVAAVEDSPEGFLAIGRCYEGPIHLEDTFLFAYRLDAPRDPDGGYRRVTRFAERQIKLTVARIEAYGKRLTELSSGSTARLLLIGDGQSVVHNDDVLGDA